MKQLCILAALSLLATVAHAAFTEDFDALRAEIAFRSLALSNSTDKIEQKQKKSCDKALAAIDKPATSLATDIKTAKKVATIMLKTFPNEFLAVNAGGITFTNNMFNLVFGTYTNLGTDVYAEIVTLGGLIAGLPDGADKLKAAAQFDIATNLLALAQNSLTFAQGSALLGKSLKAALKGQTIANNAGGGGGGVCGTITQSSVTMTASNDNFHAGLPIPGFAGAEFVQSNMLFSVGGTDGVTGNSVAFTVDSGVTGPGTYTNVSGSYAIGSPPTQTFNITGGSMTINGLDLNAQAACGTGSFTASDGVNVIDVNDFSFAISFVEVSP